MIELFKQNERKSSRAEPSGVESQVECGGQSQADSALDWTDEVIVVLAKLVVIGTAMTFYDEVIGLLLLLSVALVLVFEQHSELNQGNG